LGSVLIGSPAGTLKDILKGELDMPKLLIAPLDSFSRTLGSHLGLNLAEFELIILRSYFSASSIKRQTTLPPVTLLCVTKKKAEAIRAALTESLLPHVIDEKIWAHDFTSSHGHSEVCLSKEIEALRRRAFSELNDEDDDITLDDLVQIKSLDEDVGHDGLFTIRDRESTLGVNVEEGHGGAFRLKETHNGEVRKVAVSGVVKLPEELPQAICPFDFTPPLFGVTVLGNSNGFDHVGLATGYIIWVNRRGILVNPPAYCATRLELEMEIHPDMIKCVILTSSHGDFDQGFFQKILQEERVISHSTKTIYDSFIRKYAALSGLRPKMLRSASRFRQIRIGTPVKICGASFEFFYNLDTVPSLGFTISFGGKILLFTGGHSLSKATVDGLFEKNSLPAARRNFFANLGHDQFERIFYDAPLCDSRIMSKTLGSLDQEALKGKLLVNHSSNSDLPPGVDRGPDGRGIGSTLVFNATPPKYSSARNLVESVEAIMFFKGLSIEYAASLVQVAEIKLFKAGEKVMEAGKPILSMSIILSGRVNVVYPSHATINNEGSKGDEDKEKAATTEIHWVTGDCFGEEALITGVSTIDAVTATEVELLQIANTDLQWILSGTPVRERIQRCHDMRLASISLENVLQNNSLLRSLTRAQMLAFEMDASIQHAEGDTAIWCKGDPADFAILVVKGRLCFPNAIARLMSGLIKKSGTMMVKKEDVRHNYCPDIFTRGAWIGNVSDIIEPMGTHNNTLKANSDCVYFKIEAKAISSIFMTNPGLFVALGESEFVI
ncbi:hypothetical protein TL16_g00096, partial [Triparma laevis f. inornata]